MSIFQPPSFNPVSLFTTFVDQSVIDQQQQAFQQFNTPEAIEQRKKDRATRLSEILALSGQIVSDLRNQCNAEKLLPDIIEIDGVTVITQKFFRNCSCEDDQCLIAAISSSGVVISGLIAEAENIESKNNLDLFEPSGFPEFPVKYDDKLIDKLNVLISDWAVHVIQHSIFFPVPGASTVTVGIVNPGIALPSVTKSIASEIYFNIIKPYNISHNDYFNNLSVEYQKYNSEEEKQKRLEERLAQIPVLEQEIEFLKNELAVEQSKLSQLNSGEVILIGGDIKKKIEELQDLIEAKQFQADHPEIDPPFVSLDPFDEVQNWCEAVVFGFMNLLVKYGVVILNTITPLGPAVDTGAFSPNITTKQLIKPVAEKIAEKMKSAASINSPADLPPVVFDKIVFGLFFQSSSFLSSTGLVTGLSTGAKARII